jgi:formate dehydrogenase (hydrogenase)
MTACRRQDGPQIEKCYDSAHIYFGDAMPRPMKARLTQPLVRENGSHRPATWDEAMDHVTVAFRKSIEKNDPRNFGMFSCSKTTNELNYAAQKFVRSIMGTNNIDSCNRT